MIRPVPTLVLVHSPVVGPFSWAGVAEQLGRRGVAAIVPSLLPTLAGPPPFWRQQVNAVRNTIEGRDIEGAPLALVGHSGAGALLPLIAQQLPARVEGYVFVDAGIPRSGTSWITALPAPIVDQMRTLEHEGQLPPWHDWFGGEHALAEIIPNPALRTRFIAELRPLPWEMFEEPRPAHPDWPDAPCGYLQLSEAYDTEAQAARDRGWPTRRLTTNHLAVLTDPEVVTNELLALTNALTSAR